MEVDRAEYSGKIISIWDVSITLEVRLFLSLSRHAKNVLAKVNRDDGSQHHLIISSSLKAQVVFSLGPRLK